MTVTVDDVWLLPDVCTRALHWQPDRHGIHEGEHTVFPSFSGRIGVRRDEAGGGLFVELHGHYVPPGGAIGAGADVIALRQFARASLHGFAAKVAERLGDAVARTLDEAPGLGRYGSTSS